MNFPAILATMAKGIPYMIKLTQQEMLAPKSSINLAHIASLSAGKEKAAPKEWLPMPLYAAR